MKIIQDFTKFLKIEYSIYLIAGLFLYGIGTGILAPMNALYLDIAIGLSKVQIASIFSVSVLLNIVITLTVGYISDQLTKKKRLPLFAIILCTFGILIYMHATTYFTALIGMVIAVAPSGLIMGQLFAMARKHYLKVVPEMFEIAQVWLRAMYSVGFFTGLLLGANLYVITGFQGILWSNLLCYVLLFILLLLYREYPSIDEKQTASRINTFSWMMLLVLLLLACADALRGLYLPLVIVELFQKPQLMSYLWSVQAVFELFFMTLAGYIAMKFGTERVIATGAICAIFTYGIYSLSPPLYVFFIVQPLYSFFVSVLYGVGIGYVQGMFQSKVGFGSSVYVFLLEFAKLIGYILPFLMTGYNPKIFTIPFLLVLFAFILVIVFMFSQRKRLRYV